MWQRLSEEKVLCEGERFVELCSKSDLGWKRVCSLVVNSSSAEYFLWEILRDDGDVLVRENRIRKAIYSKLKQKSQCTRLGDNVEMSCLQCVPGAGGLQWICLSRAVTVTGCQMTHKLQKLRRGARVMARRCNAVRERWTEAGTKGSIK